MPFFSLRSLGLYILRSAIPIAIYLSSSFQIPPSSYVYSGQGFFRECAKWDPDGLRFFASTGLGGSVVEIKAGAAEEKVVIKDPDVAGNSSEGILVDRTRDRLLVVYGDVFSRYSAVGAYRLDSWERIFLTWLSGPDDEPSSADNVAIDPFGNAYITDAKSNKIWKVDPDGKLASTIRNDLFDTKGRRKHGCGLNGIVHHPNGYLLVIHMCSGRLFKVNTLDNDEVSVVNVSGSLFMGDALEMLSSGKIVAAGVAGVKLVESEDDWVSGRVSGVWRGKFWMLPSSATEKNGRVYVNHIFGWGLRRQRHVIFEAVFTPVDHK